jgi:hypothetical protein
MLFLLCKSFALDKRFHWHATICFVNHYSSVIPSGIFTLAENFSVIIVNRSSLTALTVSNCRFNGSKKSTAIGTAVDCRWNGSKKSTAVSTAVRNLLPLKRQ